MTKTKIQIKSYLGSLIFERETDSLKSAVEAAAREGISLSGADLRGADLRGAVLRGAVLSDAVLSGADLRGAVLSDAVLSGADLSGADLRGAVLRGAVLSDAVLSGADLRGAVLSGADLRGAVLSDADLRGADLREFRSDLIAEVLKLPGELENLRAAIAGGKIDGSTYSGECACLAGTIANHRNLQDISSGKVIAEAALQFRVDADSPRERWFMNIRKGDTPETNQCARLALEWVDEAIAIRDHIRGTA